MVHRYYGKEVLKKRKDKNGGIKTGSKKYHMLVIIVLKQIVHGEEDVKENAIYKF